ncbi:restriction endonuclease [Streptomyces sp. NPDC052225]|uniref:restriction endonuclease n=1 Tax=Streptomyces sp. NPDC052225 TaxID=3154949 RepID=UPI003448C9B3
MPLWKRRPRRPGSSRAQRAYVVAELRAQGRYGPELREVLPAFMALGLAVLGPLLVLALLVRGFGLSGLVGGVLLLAGAGGAGWFGRRFVVRRVQGRYSAAELGRLDRRGLARAVERMLRRDGWQVTDLSEGERVRLYARDGVGRELDVAIGTTVEIRRQENVSGAARVRESGGLGADRFLQLFVSQGVFGPDDVRWASRQDGVRLVDGRLLLRWASGVPFDQLDLSG